MRTRRHRSNDVARIPSESLPVGPAEVIPSATVEVPKTGPVETVPSAGPLSCCGQTFRVRSNYLKHREDVHGD